MEKMFTIILIICDTMCLIFLYLVTNKGSWLEIGSSISHFVIMESTILILFLLYSVATLLTTVRSRLFLDGCYPNEFGREKRYNLPMSYMKTN